MWNVFLVLLGLQAVLSGAAVVLDWTRSCTSCLSGGLAPGIAGTMFYGGLLFLALRRGPSSLLTGAILFAFGIHIALGVRMMLTGIVCGLCIGAALGSLALVTLSLARDPSSLRQLGFITPWSGLIVALGFGAAHPPVAPASPSSNSVSIVVFTQPDCSFCEELRGRVIPQIEREFGERIRIDYRPASDLPVLRRVPTLILRATQAGSETRVIEGLPTVERLRGAIRDLEARS